MSLDRNDRNQISQISQISVYDAQKLGRFIWRKNWKNSSDCRLIGRLLWECAGDIQLFFAKTETIKKQECPIAGHISVHDAQTLGKILWKLACIVSDAETLERVLWEIAGNTNQLIQFFVNNKTERQTERQIVNKFFTTVFTKMTDQLLIPPPSPDPNVQDKKAVDRIIDRINDIFNRHKEGNLYQGIYQGET